MKALILAAGEGIRMRPLTAHRPKPLLLVGGKPFLEHMLDTLRRCGIKDIIILTGWRRERIEDHFRDGTQFGVKIDYVFQEERLGTAHAVQTAREMLHDAKEFICINGDLVVNKSILSDLLNFYKAHDGTIITVSAVRDLRGFGVVELTRDKRRVKRIEEKPERPRGNLVNVGLYIFQQSIFKAIERVGRSPRGEYEITDAINLLAGETDVYGCVVERERQWIDVSVPWDLLEANEMLLRTIEMEDEPAGTIEPHATIVGAVEVGTGTIVKNGSYIVGPVSIGKNCEIGPNCLIRGPTTIGNNCKIGNAVEVKSSIIMDGAKVPHHNYVGDSIIGERCNLGSGTKVANLRLDESNIKAVVRGKLIDTGRRKLGVIMGDDVKTGINSMLNVGTIIGEGSIIGPGALAKGSIAPGSMVF